MAAPREAGGIVHPLHSSPLAAFSLADFLHMDIPERRFLLEPVLPEQGLAIIYAPRGLGKTYAALSMALAVSAGGEVYGWKAASAQSVLYIDGEMPARAMQERLNGLTKGMGCGLPGSNLFQLITPDLQPVSMPNLAIRSGQQAVEAFLTEARLVVIDNLATLCRHGRENEAESWLPVQSWLLELRRRGLSVLLVHHAGKSGDQRGTSAKEDIMDTVISLRRPKGYGMQEGARFEVHLTKARGIAGDMVKPFEVVLQQDGEALAWHKRDIEDAELDQLQRLLDDGLSVREIAEEMGKSKSAIQRLKAKL